MTPRLIPRVYTASAAPAGNAAPAAVISPKNGLIGAPMTARVTVKLAPGEKAVFPQKLALPDGVELMGVNVSPVSQEKDGAVYQEAEYTFAAFKLGPGEFPSIEASIVGPDGSARTVAASGAAPFEIVTSRTDPKTAEQLVDIRPPAPIPADWGRYLAPALALLFLIIAGALLWRYFRGGKNRPAMQPPAPPETPPHLEAMESLRKLKEDDLFSRGEGQRYFFVLSEIMRKYVERRYGAPALERTTGEIEEVFDLRFERKEKRDRLILLLSFCDEFKFARREPSFEDGDRAFDLAAKWVEETAPAQRAAPAQEGK